MSDRLPERIRSKIKIQENGCWEWIASKTGSGYGHLQWDKKFQQAHRVVYEILVGSIPYGLDLDHLCRIRSCVNPSHLEPVTRRENLRRNPNSNETKTHCPYGHEYNIENTYNYLTGRECKICVRKRMRRYYWKKKGVAA